MEKIVPTEALQELLSHNGDFLPIGEKKEQLVIGAITKNEDGQIDVEALPGCSRSSLMEIMKQVALDNNTIVRSMFGGKREQEPIIVDPEELRAQQAEQNR